MKIYEYLCGNLNHIKKQGENDKVSHWGLPGTNEDTQTKPPTFYNEPINGSARHVISGHFLFICRWTFTLFQGLIPHTEDVLWTIFCKFFPRIHLSASLSHDPRQKVNYHFTFQFLFTVDSFNPMDSQNNWDISCQHWNKLFNIYKVILWNLE